MMKRKTALVLLWIIVAAVAVENYAIARIDLDWMVVANHYDMWNAQKETWEFSPFLSMNWWDAYMLTTFRLIISCIVLGALAATAIIVALASL